jgi:hypothetical protein
VAVVVGPGFVVAGFADAPAGLAVVDVAGLERVVGVETVPLDEVAVVADVAAAGGPGTAAGAPGVVEAGDEANVPVEADATEVTATPATTKRATRATRMPTTPGRGPRRPWRRLGECAPLMAPAGGPATSPG